MLIRNSILKIEDWIKNNYLEMNKHGVFIYEHQLEEVYRARSMYSKAQYNTKTMVWLLTRIHA